MIKDGQVVTILYTLKNSEGEELDKADVKDPFTYLHGSGQIVPGLEAALKGLKKGDKKKVTVQPKDGYGEINERLKITLKKSDFPAGTSLEPGMQFVADMGEGDKLVLTVVNLDKETVEVDGNHPLAGEVLNFDVEVVDMRDATAEEIEHGHAHDGEHEHE